MRIAHVLFPAAFAGTERHVLQLCSDLCRAGHEAEVLCPAEPIEVRAAFDSAGIPVHRATLTSRLGRIDLVHAHDGRSALFARALVARHAPARFVRTQHFVRPASQSRGRGLGDASIAVHRAINRRLDAYICVSEVGARAARERADVAPDVPIEVIVPGVRLPDDQAVVAARQRREGAPPTIVSAGRLERERRLDVLLDALPAVLDAIPDARLLLAGTGDAEAELRQHARERGLDPHVTWTGWIDDLSSVFGEGRVYVNTWPDEAFGMSMVEAMGYGLPVIAPDSGSSPEVVVERETGVLVPPLDPAALARVLIELLSDSARAAAFGTAGRRRSLELYSSAVTATRTAELYQRLVSRAPAQQ